jgi:hypothetical protein
MEGSNRQAQDMDREILQRKMISEYVWSEISVSWFLSCPALPCPDLASTVHVQLYTIFSHFVLDML